MVTLSGEIIESMETGKTRTGTVDSSVSVIEHRRRADFQADDWLSSQSAALRKKLVKHFGYNDNSVLTSPAR